MLVDALEEPIEDARQITQAACWTQRNALRVLLKKSI